MPHTAKGWREVTPDETTPPPPYDRALDGKHVTVKAPKNSGTLYQKTKDFSPLYYWRLWTVTTNVSAWCNVGAHGSTRHSDCAVFNVSPLKAAVEAEALNISPPDPFLGDDYYQ